jgi:tetratricopeptide (TPR) repeat protein
MTRKIFFGFIINFLLLTAFSASIVEVNAQKKLPDKVKKLVKQADQFFQQKDYRSAVNKYAEAILISPNFPQAHFQKGYAHYYLNEYDLAITDLDLALAQGYKPEQEIYKLRWYLHYEKKNYDSALKDVQEALKIEPANNTLILGLANIYRFQGAYKDAVGVYKKVAEIESNNPDVHYFLALSYFKTGDFQAQGLAASEAVKRNTQFIGESYYLLGDALQKSKKYDEAIQAYERALNAKPDIFEIYINLSEIYRNQSKYDEAIATANKGLRLFPNNGDLYVNLSRDYSLANRNDEAIVAAQNAIKVLPNQSAAYTNLCRAYNDTKQYQKAVDACNDALRINPNDGETNYYIGRAYDLLKKPDVATEHYKKAVVGLVEYTRINPEYSDGFYLLGNALYADNQRDKAVEAYKKSLQLSPNFAKARYNLGYMYFLSKDMNSAREQYNALLKIDKDLAEKLKQAIEKK